jgi:hypothetical protein
MIKFLLSIIIVLSLLVVFLLYKINDYSSYESVNELFNKIPFDRYLLSKDYDMFKDGDIFYSINSANIVTTKFIQSPFNHVALIVKKDGVLYIIESSKIGIYRDGQNVYLNKYDNVHMELLSDTVKYSLRMSFICRLNKELDDDRRELLHTLCENYLGKKYPSSSKITAQFLLSYLSICINKDRDVINCTELIADILTKLNLISVPKCMDKVLKLVSNIHKYELNDSYYYNPPKQIVYNIY